MRRPPFSTRYPELALLLVVVIWGTNLIVLKVIVAEMHPHVLNLFRLSLSAAVLGVLHQREQRASQVSFFAPLRSHGWQIAGLGLLGSFLYQLLFILGIEATTAGSTGLIMTSVPLWTALVAHLFGLERLARLAWLGLLISLAGTALIVVAGSAAIDFGPRAWQGNLLIAAAALSWGSYTAFNKPLLQHITPISLTFLGLLLALPFLALLALPHWSTFHASTLTPAFAVALLFSGALSTGIATYLWSAAVKQIGPAYTAVFGNLVPFIALLGGYFWLGEPVTLMQLLGGGLIITGVILIRRRRPTAAMTSKL